MYGENKFLTNILFLFSLLLILLTQTTVIASTEVCDHSGPQKSKRRALLIGIGTYNSETNKAFGGLTFPDNDVAKLKELLESPRYGFSVCTLRDQEATRDGILRAIEHYLLKDAAKEDVRLFYFSGHGSWVRNSLTDENDKRDETIVPYDVIRPVRQKVDLRDIRDKELAELFNKGLDNGVILTAIFDSCHSGSVARNLESSKEIDGVGGDFDLELKPTVGQKIKPEERGALIISAAQDYQMAFGGSYSIGGLEGDFSHLTAALLLALYSSPADLTPAEDLFSRVTARLQADGRNQTPLISGTSERKQQTIFGGPTGASTGRVRAAVAIDKNTRTMYLQAGLADGLTTGCEFERIDSVTNHATTVPVHLRLTQAGLNRSTFEIINFASEGNRDSKTPVSDGDIFEQRTWAVLREPNLKVWLPPSSLGEAQIKRVALEVQKLVTSRRLDLIRDPAEVFPTHVLFYDESADKGEWRLRSSSSAQIETVGQAPLADAIFSILRKWKSRDVRLFVDFPPSAELRKQIRLGQGTTKSAVQIVSSPNAAHYRLAGRAKAQGEAVVLEYAWLLPASFIRENEAVKASLKENRDNTFLALPRVSDWACLGTNTKQCAEDLEDVALKLGKIRGWLKLSSPTPAGSERFPYRLELRKVGSEEALKVTEPLIMGESYNLFLVGEASMLKSLDIWPEFFVYVLEIDGNGTSSLLYPTRGGSSGIIELKVSEGPPPAEIQLTKTESEQIVIFDETDERSGVLGAENFILLVTTNPLPNPGSLQFKGVHTRREVEEEKRVKAMHSPLAELLLEIGVESLTRDVPTTPDDWVVDHLTFRSVRALRPDVP